MSDPTTIDEAEAESQFFQILEKVLLGQEFTITVDGRPVGRLTPPARKPSQEEIGSIIQELRYLHQDQSFTGGTAPE